MKKMYISIAIIIIAFACVGCGKEEAPASASTITIATQAPTEAVTPTPENKVVSVTNNDFRREFAVECDLPQNARVYLEKLEETQILPFLNGYKIKKVTVDTTGETIFGYTEYKLVYECVKGNSTLVFRFKTAEVDYDVSKVSDTLAIDQITLSVNDDVVREDLGAKGLGGYTR